MKSRFVFGLILAAAVLSVAACGSRATATESPTLESSATPDLCAQGNLQAEIEKVNRLMREFDDAYSLAANTPRADLRPAIADLQRIRRAAEDQDVPPCLSDLKRYQVANMNLVINSLIGLMGNQDQAAVVEGINRARQIHDLYTLEIARLLGITLVPVTSSSQETQTPAAAATQPAGPFVANAGPTTVNLRAQPALDGPTLGLLEIGQTALVKGRSQDNQWFLIEMPGQPGSSAWVFASLVTLTGSIDTIPVVTPTP